MLNIHFVGTVITAVQGKAPYLETAGIAALTSSILILLSHSKLFINLKIKVKSRNAKF
jgi:hypothetical protein